MPSKSTASDVLKAIIEQQKAESTKAATVAAPKVEVASATVTDDAAPADNFVRFSSVFGFVGPSGIDHWIPLFKDSDWDEPVRGLIPDEYPEGEYLPNHGVLESAVVAISNKERMLAYGPMGSGKSELPKFIASKLRMPWVRVNFREDMDSSALFGSPTVKDGEMSADTWVDGPAMLLGKHGGILQHDEISAGPSGIVMAAQFYLEEASKAKIYVTDLPGTVEQKTIQPHEWFVPVATDNTQLQGDTTGTYAGTKPQNGALADRFSEWIKLDYLPMSEEIEVIRSRAPAINPEAVPNMVEFARATRQAYAQGEMSCLMSTRSLIHWAKKAAYWKDVKKTCYAVFLNRLEDDELATALMLFDRHCS